MDVLTQFADIAPYLTNQFALIGFVALLLFGLFKVFIQSGIFPTFTQKVGGQLGHKILNYGFILAMCIVVLSFCWAFYQEHNAAQQSRYSEEAYERLQQENQALKLSAADSAALAQSQQATIDMLANQKGKPNLLVSVNDALKAVAEGDNTKADLIIDILLKDKASVISEAAELYRQRGALWFAYDTYKALDAVERQ